MLALVLGLGGQQRLNSCTQNPCPISLLIHQCWMGEELQYGVSNFFGVYEFSLG
jgi:hypothetical protein